MWLKTCPCCGDSLLRHVGRKGIYWFCTSCHQEMMPVSSSRQSSVNLTPMRLESMLNKSVARSQTARSFSS